MSKTTNTICINFDTYFLQCVTVVRSLKFQENGNNFINVFTQKLKFFNLKQANLDFF